MQIYASIFDGFPNIQLLSRIQGNATLVSYLSASCRVKRRHIKHQYPLTTIGYKILQDSALLQQHTFVSHKFRLWDTL